MHNPNTGSHWTTSILFSLIQELIPLYDVATDKLDGTITTKSIRATYLYSITEDQAANVIHTYNTFVKKIEELNLQTVGDARPIVDVGLTVARSTSVILILGCIGSPSCPDIGGQ